MIISTASNATPLADARLGLEACGLEAGNGAGFIVIAPIAGDADGANDVAGVETRCSASVAIKPGGVIVHIGLLEAEGGLDVRKMTLQEITFVGTYTYTMADFRDTVAALDAGVLGELSWIEKRPLAEGASAFRDLLEGRAGAAKIVLMP